MAQQKQKHRKPHSSTLKADKQLKKQGQKRYRGATKLSGIPPTHAAAALPLGGGGPPRRQEQQPAAAHRQKATKGLLAQLGAGNLATLIADTHAELVEKGVRKHCAKRGAAATAATAAAAATGVLPSQAAPMAQQNLPHEELQQPGKAQPGPKPDIGSLLSGWTI